LAEIAAASRDQFLALLLHSGLTGKVGVSDRVELPLEVGNEGVSKSNTAAALSYNR
jgi:hypothetical protein